MDTHETPPHMEVDASSQRRRETRVSDDLEIARRRMRHLEPWNVKPVPLMHSVFVNPTKPLTARQRERSGQVALKVLAVHISQAVAKSALD